MKQKSHDLLVGCFWIVDSKQSYILYNDCNYVFFIVNSFFMQYIYKYLVVRRQRFRIFLNSVISLSSYVSIICNIFMISICLSKLCVLVVLFRSPSQHSEFSNFITNVESTLHSIALKKPFLTMVLGDFNAKNKLWIG